MVDQMVQVDFINDIEALQLAQSERIFTKAANLFIKNGHQESQISLNILGVKD